MYTASHCRTGPWGPGLKVAGRRHGNTREKGTIQRERGNGGSAGQNKTEAGLSTLAFKDNLSSRRPASDRATREPAPADSATFTGHVSGKYIGLVSRCSASSGEREGFASKGTCERFYLGARGQKTSDSSAHSGATTGFNIIYKWKKVQCDER